MYSKKVIAHAGWIGLTIWLVKSLVLGAQGKLGVYIHPRFFTFTAILCGLGLVLALLSKGAPLQHNEHNHDHTDTAQWSTALSLLVAVAAAMMPAIPLSAASVINRGNETYAGTSIKLSARYEQFTIKDWSGLLAQTDDPTAYIGKPVSFDAFLSRVESTESPAMISRFSVTCCAVDAQPLSLPVRTTQPSDISINQWVRVSGSWQLDKTTERGMSIRANSLEPITQPKEPYVY